MLLSELEPGDKFSVLRVLSGGEIGKRLADMGFTEGAEGEFVRGAFLHGPLQVKIRGYALLIRRGEAKLIEIAKLSPGIDTGTSTDTSTGKDEGAGVNKGAGIKTVASVSAAAPRSWKKSRARRFFVSLFSEPDCCAGSRKSAGRGGR